MLTERLEENRIYNEDCLDTLERMEDSLLDLTVTSPPYNVSLDYNTYDDNKKHDDYIEWLSEIFSMIYLKTKVGGRCVINIGDGKNGSVPTHSDIIQMMKEIGWIPMTTIIWDKCQTHSRTAWAVTSLHPVRVFRHHLNIFLYSVRRLVSCNGKEKLI